MKRIQNCEVENCIPTLSSCVEWNGGEVKFLGICDGDQLNNLLWEVINKLEEIAGEDLSQFDLDSLLDICNQKAPTEVTIISILNILKTNQICLKDFIDTLNERLNELFAATNISVNLKCYAQFDNLGNSLSITREQLDQLIIDNLCSQKLRIDSLEGNVISLQSQIDNIEVNPTVTEPEFSTCVDVVVKPTSGQTVSIANSLCELKDVTGTGGQITTSFTSEPAVFSTFEYKSLAGWNITPLVFADHYSNLLIAFNYLIGRVTSMENTCCAASCKDVLLGFSPIYNEDNTGVIIRFTAGAGTDIPAGFIDIGSTITITDVDGNVETYITANPNLIANNASIEVPIAGLNINASLVINVDANMSNGALTCSKCINKTLNKAQCDYCEVCVAGGEGSSVVILYTSSSSSVVIENSSTSSTTTTTTIGI
jgi:hypothetical protein